MSQLAKAVFGVPATNAPSARLFAAAGVTLNAKRSRLAPLKVDKILLVHSSVHLTEDSSIEAETFT